MSDSDSSSDSDSDFFSSDSDANAEVDEAVFGDPEALRALPPDRVEPTLNAAAAGGWRAVVEALLARGVVDLASEGRPLLVAAENGHLEVVTALLAANATVDLANNNGATPLFVAAHGGHHEVVTALLAANATVDVAANDGGSPLLAAVFATAPTGVPLSLWLVYRAAHSGAGAAGAGGAGDGARAAVDSFLQACVGGVVALAAFCVGGLALVRSSATEPSLAGVLAAGYLSWAAVWGLQRLTKQLEGCDVPNWVFWA